MFVEDARHQGSGIARSEIRIGWQGRAGKRLRAKFLVRDSSPLFHPFDQDKALTSSMEPAQARQVFVLGIFFAIELGGSCSIEHSAPRGWQVFLALSSLKRGSRGAQERWTQGILWVSLSVLKALNP
jgi:hypothetical protein